MATKRDIRTSAELGITPEAAAARRMGFRIVPLAEAATGPRRAAETTPRRPRGTANYTPARAASDAVAAPVAVADLLPRVEGRGNLPMVLLEEITQRPAEVLARYSTDALVDMLARLVRDLRGINASESSTFVLDALLERLTPSQSARYAAIIADPAEFLSLSERQLWKRVFAA